MQVLNVRAHEIEIAVDSFVHGIGFALAVVGSTFIFSKRRWCGNPDCGGGRLHGRPDRNAYRISALQHEWQWRFKRLARRLDHAAIFVMIAGSYTPFALISIGGGRSS